MKVLEERAETHGDFKSGAIVSQQLKSMFQTEDMVSKEAVDNIIQKAVRIKFGHKLNIDSWRDIAGYAKLGGDACEERDIALSKNITEQQAYFLSVCNDKSLCFVITVLFTMANISYSKNLFYLIVDKALERVKELEETPGAIDVICKKKEIK